MRRGFHEYAESRRSRIEKPRCVCEKIKVPGGCFEILNWQHHNTKKRVSPPLVYNPTHRERVVLTERKQFFLS